MRDAESTDDVARRDFFKRLAVAAPLVLAAPRGLAPRQARWRDGKHGGVADETVADERAADELAADLVVIGGGLGGCAAAVVASRRGLRVVMTKETDWIGGQRTQQAVPPDENA